MYTSIRIHNIPERRNYFSSKFRIYIHEIDFRTKPDLTELPPGLHYAVTSCTDHNGLTRDIRDIIRACISEDPVPPAGFSNGALTAPNYQLLSRFTQGERDHLYSRGINPILRRGGKTCLFGHRIIRKNGCVANLVHHAPRGAYPQRAFIDDDFLEGLESPFCVRINDCDSQVVTNWCCDNCKSDFLCTFMQDFARVYFEDERDASLFKLFFYRD